METKRIKISFNTINKGKCTVINRSEIAEVNRIIRGEMKGVVRAFEKNENISQKNAAKLVLNA